MSFPVASYIDAAERLCTTLERIGDALVEIDAPTLLDTEATLGQLLAVLASSDAAGHAAEIEPLMRRARAAVLRCRRLGASYAGVAKGQLQLCVGVGYGRDGGVVEEAGRPALDAVA